MKLYTYFRSSASYRVRIALGLKGLRAEMAYVNLLKAEQRSPDYARINPQMVVPSFIQRGHTLTQSLAILEYLEETHPAAPLLPKGPFARAYVRALCLIIACDTSPLANLGVRNYLKEKLGQNKEAEETWIRHWIGTGLAAFEKQLAQSGHAGEFCHSDTPGMADCCLIPQVYNAERFRCDLSPYPRINAISKRCAVHPAFLAAHPDNQEDKS